MEVHLLGTVDWQACLRLQRRIAADLRASRSSRCHLLVCEHPPVITLGRNATRTAVRRSDNELSRRGIRMHWIHRGGGAMLHAPGQLAIYPILSLYHRQWLVGEYLNRLQLGIQQALEALGARTVRAPGCHALLGRQGALATFGIHVQEDITTHGCFLNANTPHELNRLVRVLPSGCGLPTNRQGMSSLVAEHGRPAKMSNVRSHLLPAVAGALDCHEFHPISGHPWLARAVSDYPSSPRAG